jgi:cytochrome P450
MCEEQENLPPRFDPFELARGDDPYGAYAKLRAAGPLLRGGPGVWVFSRHKEVSALLRDPRLGQFQFQEAARLLAGERHSSPLGGGPADSFMQRILVASNGPDHARLRKAVGQAFTPKLFQDLRGHVALLVEELLIAAAARGASEMVSGLAYPLPLMVLCRLLGIPREVGDEVGRRVLKLSKLFAPVIATEDRAAADAAVDWLRGYVASLLQRPSDGVMSAMKDAGERGLLNREEVIDNVIFLIFAGLETSMNLIAAGCAALSQNPAEMARLREDPSHVSAAVEEFLRYDTPTQITARIVHEPVEVAGRTLRKGRVLVLLLGSANHDEAQFSEPERLDIGRHPNPHVSFGAGAHYCIGAGLARLESEVLFYRLSQKFRVFEPAGEVVREPSATPRIYSSVPLRLAADASPVG